ncbi:diguanylate cyclase [Permianibacter sp. IMCC34836]|uniref:tetratricopeptide repeat-containing diguanylate cyclase n=1 Tax=Permianibacter fluminis TaxID=2738515 RepID=UPI0015516966|nr:diguanylate cyclase [Permianibacter fluminis]NQD35867.1 diguanylate cyclase [Permianibacter fluminis]
MKTVPAGGAGILLLLAVVLAGSANGAVGVAAAPSADSSTDTASQLAEVEALANTDAVAALARVQQLKNSAGFQSAPAALATLHALECNLVINDQPKQAIALAESALQTPDLPGKPRIRLQICRGQGLDWTGQPEPARQAFDAALADARKNGDALLIVEVLSALAALDSYQGRYVRAAASLREAQALVDQARAALPLDIQANAEHEKMRELRNVQLSLWQRLGVLYIGMDDGEKAMQYFQQVLTEVEARKEVPGQITALYNIGRALEEQGKLDEAWKAQYRSYELAKAAGDNTSVAWAQRSLGAIRVQQDRYDEAAPYIDAAIRAFEQIADAEILAQLTFYRARIARHRGDVVAAERDLRAALVTFRQNQTLRYLDRVLSELSALRQQAGDLPEALTLLQERDRIHRALDLQIQDRAAARLQAEFDNQAQQKENQRLAELQQWQARQLQDASTLARQQYLIIVLAGLIAIFVAYFAVRQLRIARHMRAMALTDELTKVPNRRAVYQLANEHWRSGVQPFSLLLLDIDYFKRVNDRFGHACGDQALQLVAQCCRDQLRQGDTIGRIGGEEFMVLLPGANASTAVDVAERLRKAVVQAPAGHIASELSLAISLGVATRQRGETNLQALIQRADAALYQAKAAGRNQTVLAEENASDDVA